MEHAKSTSVADLKIIANDVAATKSLSKISGTLSQKGNLASMLEGLNQGEIGKG